MPTLNIMKLYRFTRYLYTLSSFIGFLVLLLNSPQRLAVLLKFAGLSHTTIYSESSFKDVCHAIENAAIASDRRRYKSIIVPYTGKIGQYKDGRHDQGKQDEGKQDGGKQDGGKQDEGKQDVGKMSRKDDCQRSGAKGDKSVNGYRRGEVNEADKDGRVIFTHCRHRECNVEGSDHESEASECDSYGGVDNAREVSGRVSHLTNNKAHLV